MLRFVLIAVLCLLVAFVGWAVFRHGLGELHAAPPDQAVLRSIPNPPSFVVLVGEVPAVSTPGDSDRMAYGREATVNTLFGKRGA